LQPEPIRYYDRYARETRTEKVFGERWLRLAYDNPVGRFAVWLLIRRRFFSLYYGRRMNRPGSDMLIFKFVEEYGVDVTEFAKSPFDFKTFNEFFARKFKPGHRPVAAPSDPRVIVSPADSTFDGQWEIRPDSHVTLKGLHWQVSELMVDSKYSGRFTTGHFMHAFLSPTDYHRQHAPLAGKVLEARVIPGQVYLEVAVDTPGTPGTAGAPSGKRLKAFRTLDAPGGSIYAPGSSIYAPGSDINAPDNPGYQFAQARGLIVLETEIGLVAVLPIGMAQVSSVKLSVKPGQKVNKGDEISYFQFGGSDIVLLFEAKSNVNLTAQVGVHYKMGTVLGSAFPAS